MKIGVGGGEGGFQRGKSKRAKEREEEKKREEKKRGRRKKKKGENLFTLVLSRYIHERLNDRGKL